MVISAPVGSGFSIDENGNVNVDLNNDGIETIVEEVRTNIYFAL